MLAEMPVLYAFEGAPESMNFELVSDESDVYPSLLPAA